MTTEAVNNNLNILIDPTFTNVNKLFVLAYQAADDRQSFSQFYLPRAMVKDYNVIIDKLAFKYKISLLGNVTEVAGNAAGVRRLNVKVVVPLKYLSNFFRSLEMPLINCEIKLNLTWKKECVLSTGGGDAVFIINDTKLCAPVVTLSKEDNKDFIEQNDKNFKDLFIGMNIKQKK